MPSENLIQRIMRQEREAAAALAIADRAKAQSDAWAQWMRDNELNGKDGQDGKDGKEGPAGPRGDPGPRGEAGPQGPTGPQGPAGTPGTDGSDGRPGHDGAPGSPGREGPPGPKGDTGKEGAPAAWPVSTALLYNDAAPLPYAARATFPNGAVEERKFEYDADGRLVSFA